MKLKSISTWFIKEVGTLQGNHRHLNESFASEHNMRQLISWCHVRALDLAFVVDFEIGANRAY